MSSQLLYQPGTYRVKVVRWGLSKAGTGNPQFVLSFVPFGMVDHADPEHLIQCADQERSIFRTITAKSVDYFAQDLKRLGYERESFGDLNPESPTAFNFQDMVLDVTCSHERWEGKTREKWNFAWGGGFEIQPLEQAEVKKLDALFGRALKSNPVAPAPATQAISKNEQRTQDIENILNKKTPVTSGEQIPF